MPDITNQPIDHTRVKADKELLQVIDEFLELSDFDEDIAASVYFLFSSHGIDIGTRVFSNAAASALYFFATDTNISEQIKKKLGDDFYYLCELLQKTVEFCNNITCSEANLARLDKTKWEGGYTYHLSLEEVQEEKSKYEYKLKNLRAYIQRIKNS